ncbi:MAG TPA: response regulator transcription factor [Anaeromyxobacter sp.]|nr:response regulator transcription factor [Anaeromyxobacter sp.]
MVLVLVVDDESDIRQAVAEILSSEGFEVVSACDGAEALDKARRYHPVLVLLDLMMPRMDGWAFRRAQMRDPEVSKIPVVVLSAVGPDAVDADGYVGKPFDVDELVTAVRRYAAPLEA